MPVVHVSHVGNLFADCQSVHQGYKVQDSESRHSPGSGLLTEMVCLRSVLVLLMDVKNTTPIQKRKQKGYWEMAGEFLHMNKLSFDCFC